MELYIVRHGETVWNLQKRLQGGADIALSETGRQMALELGARLKDVGFDRIYSSPLRRAYETAQLVCGKRKIPIIRDGRLREISFGKMEGVFYTEWLADTSPYRFFFDEPEKYVPPEGGESFEEVMARTREFLQEKVEPEWEKCGRIMIVAHGALNKGLMCHIEGNTKKNYWGNGLQKNCEAEIFTYNGSRWTAGREA